MNTQTMSVRTRLLRTALDSADITATVTAGATCGLITYRTLATRRPPELRVTLALATGALAAALTDQHTYTLLAPLRRRLGIQPGPATTVAAPSLASLGKDVQADAAHRAATRAWRIDHSLGSLRHAQNWRGAADGTATCQLLPQAVLRYQPSHEELGTSASDGWEERYDLLADGDAVKVVSVSQLRELLERLADGKPLRDQEDFDPWADGDDGSDPVDHRDLDDEDDHGAPEQTSYADEPPF
jgi:hypothetical protein